MIDERNRAGKQVVIRVSIDDLFHLFLQFSVA